MCSHFRRNICMHECGSCCMIVAGTLTDRSRFPFCAAHQRARFAAAAAMTAAALTNLALRMCNQPLQRDVDVVLFLARNAVAADLAILYAGQIHALDQASLVEGAGHVTLIAQHQHRNANQLWFVQQRVQLITRCLHLVHIGGVHHVTGM